jgi:hypothetical protein
MSRQILGPHYGVTYSPSDDFQTASRHVFAWFNDKNNALYFVTDRLCSEDYHIYVWDLDLGVKVLDGKVL